MQRTRIRSTPSDRVTRSYNVQREEIVGAGEDVEEESDVTADNTEQDTDIAAPASPASKEDGSVTDTRTSSQPDPFQAPAVQAEQQTSANVSTTPANGNVDAPSADSAPMQAEDGQSSANVTETAASAPASAQDIVSDKNTPMPIHEDTGEPDYARATPERTREYLYNEAGLEADEADAYVENNARNAQKELNKVKGKKPKMGTSLVQFRAEKAAWQQRMDEAQRNVDYWEGVKDAGQETAQGMAPAQDSTNGAAPVDAMTDAQNMGQTAAPAAGNAVDAGEQRASLRRKSYVMGEQAAAVAKAEEETNVEPTEAQKKAGNYKKGHLKIDGFDVSIEQPKGSVRRGTDASGRQWEQTMNNTYGYIRGTEGVDGDHIDVFLSDDPSHGDVFVVDQVNKDGTFDEHKVMYGFADEESARQAYLSNHEEGWTGLGAITHVTKDEFRKWVNSSRRKTKPFAEYKGVKVEGAPTLSQEGDKVDDQDNDARIDERRKKNTFQNG